MQAVAGGKVKNMAHLKGIDRPSVCNPNNQSDFGYQTLSGSPVDLQIRSATYFDIEQFDHESFDSFYHVQWQVGAAKVSRSKFDYPAQSNGNNVNVRLHRQ